MVTILTDTLEEHLEEADFLRSHRQSALADRDSTLKRQAEIEAHLPDVCRLTHGASLRSAGNDAIIRDSIMMVWRRSWGK